MCLFIFVIYNYYFYFYLIILIWLYFSFLDYCHHNIYDFIKFLYIYIIFSDLIKNTFLSFSFDVIFLNLCNLLRNDATYILVINNALFIYIYKYIKNIYILFFISISIQMKKKEWIQEYTKLVNNGNKDKILHD